MGHCNSYGSCAGLAAICAAISWYLVQERSCKISIPSLTSDTFTTDNLQIFHYIAIIVGLVIFVLSFFDFASILHEITLLFFLAAVGIYAAAGMMLYATYMAFHMSCKSAFNNIFDTANLMGAKNVFEAGDQYGIAIMALDLIAALALISAACSFHRTY